MKKLGLAIMLLTFTIGTPIASAASAAQTFPDVYQDMEYYYSIDWSVSKGITGGFGDGYWRPDNCVTRGEIMKMVLEFKFKDKGGFKNNISLKYKESGFPDVDVTAWYNDYITYGRNLGFIEGYPDNTFQPGRCVNRVEAMKIVFNGLLKDIEDLGSYHSGVITYDDKVIADMVATEWYGSYASYFFSKRLAGTVHTQYVEGSTGTPTLINYFPSEPMTRKEFVYLLNQTSDKVIDHVDPPTPQPTCTREGESLGAVYPGNDAYCCSGLEPYIAPGVVGTKGICAPKNDYVIDGCRLTSKDPSCALKSEVADLICTADYKPIDYCDSFLSCSPYGKVEKDSRFNDCFDCFYKAEVYGTTAECLKKFPLYAQ